MHHECHDKYHDSCCHTHEHSQALHSKSAANASHCCSCHCCNCHCHQEGKYADELLKLADEAWMEVLKEKIKEEIIQTSDAHLSQMAKLVAGANHLRWKEKLQAKKDLHDYEEQLRSMICRQGGKPEKK